MQIDWITVAAQIVNFLVLLWVLKRFLYRPVIEAMDRREAAIAARIAAAEAREREADAARGDYQAKTRELDAARRRMIEEAEAAAATERQRLVAAAREEVAEERRGWLDAVRADQAEFVAALNETAATEICAIAREVLGDLAHAELEPQLVAAFLDKLHGLGAEERRELAAAAAEAESRVTVKSAPELSAGLRDDLREALRSVFGEDIRIRFLKDPDTALGIQVIVGSRVLTWSVDGYMDQLERRLVDEIEELAPERTER